MAEEISNETVKTMWLEFALSQSKEELIDRIWELMPKEQRDAELKDIKHMLEDCQ